MAQSWGTLTRHLELQRWDVLEELVDPDVQVVQPRQLEFRRRVIQGVLYPLSALLHNSLGMFMMRSPAGAAGFTTVRNRMARPI